ncbi:MAG TPA: hypothetical protein VFW39_01885 [Sphingomicrobium sp.]|nr:hypothetical protein [Sphingomicrobium sp.]
MHVHVPKPLHGWRAFVGEVGIIVLGVLIALGFGQIVEQWQWHRQVVTTRDALANELAASANQGGERLALEECLRGRIGELSARLNSNNDRWVGDPLPLGPGGTTAHWDDRSIRQVYWAPLRGWSQDSWDAAKSSEVVDHMSRDEVAAYSAVYAEIEAIHDFQGQEFQLESKLSFLSVDQTLDNGTRNDALEALGQLDALNSTIAGLSSLMIEQIKGFHLHVDRARLGEDLKRSIAGERQYRGSCVKDVRVQF